MYAMPRCHGAPHNMLFRDDWAGCFQHWHATFYHFDARGSWPGGAAGIPKDTPAIAEVLRDGGYETHMTGKWVRVQRYRCSCPRLFTMSFLPRSTWATHHLRRPRWGVNFCRLLIVGYLQGQTNYYNRAAKSCGKDLCLYMHNGNGGGGPMGGVEGEAYDFCLLEQRCARLLTTDLASTPAAPMKVGSKKLWPTTTGRSPCLYTTLSNRSTSRYRAPSGSQAR
jgi:hypothetical protein